MMKRRTKLRKRLLRSHSQPTLNKLLTSEKHIITSHINERSHEEIIAVAKIKEVPYLFLDMQRGSLSPNRILDHSIRYVRKKALFNVIAITERRDMGLYEVPLSMFLLGFGIGTMLTNFQMCGIMLLLIAVLNMLVWNASPRGSCVLGV